MPVSDPPAKRSRVLSLNLEPDTLAKLDEVAAILDFGKERHPNRSKTANVLMKLGYAQFIRRRTQQNA